MNPLVRKTQQRLGRFSSYLLHLGLFCLVIVGIMSIVHNVSWSQPSDGAHWEMRDGRVTVVDIDRDHETVFEIGDVLRSINDTEIKTTTEREDYLYGFDIDTKRPHLYRIERSGSELNYWVYIRGIKQKGDQEYYLRVLTGFVYLVFLILLLSRNISFNVRRSLAFFCFTVFLTFVFRNTNSFTNLDWLAFYLSQAGKLLLPSAIACVAISQALGKTGWSPHAQAIHWTPTGLLIIATFSLILFPEDVSRLGLGGDIDTLFLDVRQIQRMWSGALTTAAILVLGLVAELRSKERNLTVFWACAWLPSAFLQLGFSYPYDEVLAATMPAMLPLAFLFDWSRSGRLYLGTIAKKVIVYFTVVVMLLLAYALFIALFQALLGTKISSAAHTTILVMGIMFAAITYAPLNHYAADLLDRMVYGKRYTSIREFSDLTEITRADIDVDDFLISILGRIKRAFRVEDGTAYKVDENIKHFRTIAAMDKQVSIVFEDLDPRLLNGRLVRGHEVNAYLIGESRQSPFLPNDYICPLRVSGSLKALLVINLQGNDLKLTPEEENLLRSVLRQCGVLMENMELYHAIHQKAISINQLKEYNENIIESSRIGILTTDEMGRTVSFNHTLQELTGLEQDNIMGTTFDELFQKKRVTNQRQTKSGSAVEGSYLNRSDKLLDLEIQKTPLKTRENEVYGTLYMVEDIRDKKKLHEKMMQQEKLASLGLLAAGVAHEINTPLTGIASYAQIMGSDPGVNEEQKELLDLIQDQSRRAAKIVNELLNFSRKGGGPKGPVDLLSVLNQTLRFLSHQIQKRQVRITLNEPRDPAIIEGYDNQIQQIFLNLIVNAMDAMPDGGDLTVSFGEKHKQIELSFQDTGVGMNEKTRVNIFDPFFTTKEMGKGTGLGLAVVYNILEDHGATVEVESEEGKGTTFHLFWPRIEPRRNAVPAGDAASYASTQGHPM